MIYLISAFPTEIILFFYTGALFYLLVDIRSLFIFFFLIYYYYYSNIWFNWQITLLYTSIRSTADFNSLNAVQRLFSFLRYYRKDVWCSLSLVARGGFVPTDIWPRLLRRIREGGRRKISPYNLHSLFSSKIYVSSTKTS